MIKEESNLTLAELYQETLLNYIRTCILEEDIREGGE